MFFVIQATALRQTSTSDVPEKVILHLSPGPAERFMFWHLYFADDAQQLQLIMSRHVQLGNSQLVSIVSICQNLCHPTMSKHVMAANKYRHIIWLYHFNRDAMILPQQNSASCWLRVKNLRLLTLNVLSHPCVLYSTNHSFIHSFLTR
jgi:hypothetical protein